LRIFNFNIKMSSFKVSVMGCGGVGKSAITNVFCSGVFIEKYDPTIEDSYRRLIEVDGNQHLLEILDTAGTEHFTAMREMYIRSGNGFILVYSITVETTLVELEEIRNQIVEIKDSDKVPVLLVGNKIDLEDHRVISTQKGKDKAKEWNANFIEASAKTGQNIPEIFATITRMMAKEDDSKKSTNEKPKRKCTIL